MVPHAFGDQRTEKKLELVHEYAKLYVTVLSSAEFSPVKHYIDCCSGTGEVTLKNGQTIDGSAIRMAQLNFDLFHFIEVDREKIENLKNKLNELAISEKAHYYQEDLNSSLIEILERIKIKENDREKPQRVLIFLDPYGLQVKWDTVKKIAQYHFVDVIYLFPSHAILRGIPRKYNGTLQPDMREKIINVYGLDEREIIDRFY